MYKSEKFQTGMTLIEVMVAMAILASLSLGFIRYHSNLVKTESLMEIRQSISDSRGELLKEFHRDACRSNVTKAFRDVPIVIGGETLGNPSYTEVNSSTYYLPSPNPPRYREEARRIFAEGDFLSQGRVMVDDVTYKLTNVRAMSGGGFSHRGEMELEVKFAHCSYSSPMRRGLAATCQGEEEKIIKPMKVVRPMLFNLDGNTIAKKSIGVGLVGAGTAEVLDVRCFAAPSTDVERKACLTEAHFLASNGFEGITDCNYIVETTYDSRLFDVTGNIRLPTGIAEGSLTFSIVGGGGAGGNVSHGSPGLGGQAGVALENIRLPHSLAGATCRFTAGLGGQESGDNGGESSLSCPGFLKRVPGGVAGMTGALDETNIKGADGENSIFSIGGVGTYTKGQNATLGAGGGAAGKNTYKSPIPAGKDKAGSGGNGAVEFRYIMVRILDGNNKNADLTPIPTPVRPL